MNTPLQTDNRLEVEAASRAALPPAVVEQIDRARALPHPESHLISVLHRLQSENGWLGTKQLEAVAQLLGVPSSKVTGVATFYAFFRLQPRGRYAVNVCLGTACYVSGADRVLEKLKEELGVEVGETAKDGVFSLEVSRCLGTCGLAPVILLDNQAIPKVKPEKVGALIATYREKAKAG